MSLVGPRPHAIGMKTGDVEIRPSGRRLRPSPPDQARHDRLGRHQRLARPAAHRPGRARRVQLDVDYIERQSLWLDLWIMAITVPVLLGDRAAIR
jgi:lipopolysaccharide/colanic/teichoic acid biosynthesis glycosyltransferase